MVEGTKHSGHANLRLSDVQLTCEAVFFMGPRLLTVALHLEKWLLLHAGSLCASWMSCSA